MTAPRREREILEQLAAELTAAGHPVAPEQLRWVLDEFRERVMRAASSSRYAITGRLQGEAVRAVVALVCCSLLAGCGGSKPPAEAPPATPERLVVQASERDGWVGLKVVCDTATGNLLYVATIATDGIALQVVPGGCGR